MIIEFNIEQFKNCPSVIFCYEYYYRLDFLPGLIWCQARVCGGCLFQTAKEIITVVAKFILITVTLNLIQYVFDICYKLQLLKERASIDLYTNGCFLNSEENYFLLYLITTVWGAISLPLASFMAILILCFIVLPSIEIFLVSLTQLLEPVRLMLVPFEVPE